MAALAAPPVMLAVASVLLGVVPLLRSKTGDPLSDGPAMPRPRAAGAPLAVLPVALTLLGGVPARVLSGSVPAAPPFLLAVVLVLVPVAVLPTALLAVRFVLFGGPRRPTCHARRGVRAPRRGPAATLKDRRSP